MQMGECGCLTIGAPICASHQGSLFENFLNLQFLRPSQQTWKNYWTWVIGAFLHSVGQVLFQGAVSAVTADKSEGETFALQPGIPLRKHD